jgi:hypothetical protein
VKPGDLVRTESFKDGVERTVPLFKSHSQGPTTITGAVYPNDVALVIAVSNTCTGMTECLVMCKNQLGWAWTDNFTQIQGDGTVVGSWDGEKQTDGMARRAGVRVCDVLG